MKDPRYAGGAKGNGSTDDTAAIQAAISAMDDGSTIVGTLFFPKGVYKISDPIVIGNGTKYVSVSIVGQSYHSASNAPLDTVILKPTNINEDAIQFNAAPTISSSLVIEGIQIKYASVGTGIAFNMAAGSQTTGPILNNCVAQAAGVGIHIGDSVNARLSNCVFITCDIGVKLEGGTPNLPQFENCTFQANTTAGVSVSGFVGNARFTSCVFQANTGPGLLTTGSGVMLSPVFDACWWEFPGTDMIRVSGISAGFSFERATFIGCLFDGSGNNRNVINILAAAASGVFVRNATFINCVMANTGSGRLLYTATDPTGSSDPGFLNISIIGGSVFNLKGLHTYLSANPANFFVQESEANLNVETSTVYGVKPSHALVAGNKLTLVQMSLIQSGFGPGYHELKEDSTSDAAAGAADTGRLYVRDNGAGKTQLCVRFNTGAVQVIATEP